MKIIEQQWLSYRSAVLPKEAPLIQLQECRRAFYAGAQALLQTLLTAVSPGQEVTDEDAQVLERVQKELDEFAKAVESGVK